MKTSSLQELDEICNALEINECVFKATCDYVQTITTKEIPNDPWKARLIDWNSWDVSNPEGNNWWAEAVDLPGAWEYDTVKITVGVVDEGFDFEHEDYKNNIKSKHNENIGKSPEHGTRLTGIIAAEHNNKKGLSGVNKNCDLILSEWKNPEGDAKEYVTDPVDNNDNFEITTTDMIVGETVNQIIEGAKVVNISAGSMWYEKEDDNKFNMLSHLEYIDREAEVASAFLYNLLARNYDFVIVQSAGNGF